MKTMKAKKVLLLFSLTIAVCSCSEFQILPASKPKTIYKIAPELQYYVDLFEQQALNYGRTFKHDNLIILVTDSLRNNIDAGLYNEKGQKVIYFTDHFLQQSSADEIELMTFHQLGHLHLKKDHEYGYSIMNPDLNISDYRDPIKRRIMLAGLFN